MNSQSHPPSDEIQNLEFLILAGENNNTCLPNTREMQNTDREIVILIVIILILEDCPIGDNKKTAQVDDPSNLIRFTEPGYMVKFFSNSRFPVALQYVQYTCTSIILESLLRGIPTQILAPDGSPPAWISLYETKLSHGRSMMYSRY
jgi:hypothetical protein